MTGRTISNLILVTLICVVIFFVFAAIRPAPAGTPVTLNNKEIIGEWCDYRYERQGLSSSRRANGSLSRREHLQMDHRAD